MSCGRVELGEALPALTRLLGPAPRRRRCVEADHENPGPIRVTVDYVPRPYLDAWRDTSVLSGVQ